MIDDTKKIKNIFISDAHLGSKYARTDILLDFLKWVKNQNPDKLYIIGDFIDGWKLKRNWFWNKECNLIIRKIFSLLKHDVQVFYIAGNHDEFLRDYFHDLADLNLAGLTIGDEFVHDAINGDKLLIVHGDKFDTVIRFAMKYTRWMCYLGDFSYDMLIWLNNLVNWLRRKFGFKKYWSLSKTIKQQFKDAICYIGSFANILSEYAREKGCDGVICGHIHTPDISTIKDIKYFNTGDWVESCSAIVEYDDGSFQLVFWLLDS